MRPETLRIIAGIVILAHGIGHVMGYFPVLGLTGGIKNWSDRSWILGRLVGDSVARVIGLALWTALLIGFVMTALAVFGWLVPQEWFRDLALWSSAGSLLALFLFPNAFAQIFNKVGAVAVNVALLVILLWKPWPPLSDL